MKDRIKTVRKNLGISQKDFGLSVGVGQSAVAGYESGSKEPINSVIIAICTKYGIDEKWLRTGDGDMYAPKSKEEEIAEMVKAFFDSDDPRKLNVVKWFMALDDDELKLLESFAKALLGRE